MVLVLVESESKAKTLSAQLDIEIKGVVVKELPMTVSHDAAISDLHTGKSGFHFIPRDSGRKIIQAIHDNSEQRVLIAFDNDQRAEYWGWMIKGFLDSSDNEKKVCKRINVGGLQRNVLKDAMDKSVEFPFADGAAFYIRSLFNGYLIRHLNRLIGTSAGPSNLPLDYTTLTILFLLADRHNMISPGTSPAVLKLLVKLSSGSSEFYVRLRKGPNVSENGTVSDSDQVKKILSRLQEEKFILESMRKKSASVSVPEPLDLSKLLNDASCLLGLQPGELWTALIELYHGADIDGIWTGLISDPFGRVKNGRDGIVDQIRFFVNNTFGENSVTARDCIPSAILPLQPELTADALHGVVSEKTAKLYELIRSRAIMSQMCIPHGDEMEIDIMAGDFIFSCHGICTEMPGFLQAQSRNEYDMLQLFSDNLQKGESLEIIEMQPRPIANTQAGQYTLSSLVDELKDFSIPLSSSLPNILQKMVDGQYIRILPDGTILCLENTKKVVNTVNRIFPKMQGVNLSAYFEQTVMEVLSARKNIDFALKQFDQNFQNHGVSLVKTTSSASVIPRGKRSKNIIKSPAQESSGAAKTASADLPQHTETCDAQIEESEAVQTKEQKDQIDESEIVENRIIEKGGNQPEINVREESEKQGAVESFEESKIEEEKTESLSGGNLEEEKKTQTLDSDSLKELAGESIGELIEPEQEKSEPQEVPGREEKQEVLKTAIQPEEVSLPTPSREEREHIPCPFCGNDHLLVKHTSSDKIYYECSVSNCEFIAWARPHGIYCPKCKSPYLVEKKGSDGTILQCPKAGCRYEQPVTNGGEGASDKKKKKVLVKRKKGGGTAGTKKRKVVVRRKRG